MLGEGEVHFEESSNPPLLIEACRKARIGAARFVGETNALVHPMAGFMASRDLDPESMAAINRIEKEIRNNGWRWVSTVHSPLEREFARMLGGARHQIVRVMAKNIDRSTLGGEASMRAIVSVSPTARRESRESALKAARLVFQLSRAMLLLAAPSNSGVFRLASEALQRQATLFAPETQANMTILDRGVRPWNPAEFSKALGVG